MKNRLQKTAGISVLSLFLFAGMTTFAEETKEPIMKSVGVGTVLEELSLQGEAAEKAPIPGYSNLGIAKVDNHLNIRAIAADDGKLVGKLAKDAACEILSFDGKWAKIKSGKVEGYVATDFLLMGERAADRAKEVISTVATVTTAGLKVREEPNTECPVVTSVANGEELEVVDTQTDGWVKVLLDDEEAFVSEEFVKVEEKLSTAVTMTELLYGEGVSDVRVDLSQYAKSFVGNPYVWGGTSLTKGADCSGFTKSVFKKYGINLPRSSGQQVNVGTKIALSEAKPGDLIFYAKGGRINHVAIYIGSGQVVHASSPKTGIRISNANYRTPHSVRRVISQ